MGMKLVFPRGESMDGFSIKGEREKIERRWQPGSLMIFPLIGSFVSLLLSIRDGIRDAFIW